MFKYIWFVVVMLFSQHCLAEWKLVNHESSLSFITTKNGAKTEVHRFTELEGVISDRGGVSLKINLASVETDIPIRNKRIKEMFFHTDKFPRAEISFDLNEKQTKALEASGLNTFVVTAQCNLHGVRKPVSAKVRVAILPDGVMLVTTVEPIIFSIADYKLMEGLNKLREVAKLESIAPFVPVSLNLVYRR